MRGRFTALVLALAALATLSLLLLYTLRLRLSAAEAREDKQQQPIEFAAEGVLREDEDFEAAAAAARELIRRGKGADDRAANEPVRGTISGILEEHVAAELQRPQAAPEGGADDFRRVTATELASERRGPAASEGAGRAAPERDTEEEGEADEGEMQTQSATAGSSESVGATRAADSAAPHDDALDQSSLPAQIQAAAATSPEAGESSQNSRIGEFDEEGEEAPDAASATVVEKAALGSRASNLPVLLRDPAQCTAEALGDGLVGGDGRPLEVTLITQASGDRLWMLPYICERWGGPMVVAALLPSGASGTGSLPWPTSLSPNSTVPRCKASLLELRPPQAEYKQGIYPINWLRNQAIRCARTSHYLIADVDFWPSVELLPLLRLQLTAWGERKRAVVVPNFQRSGHGCRAKGPYACREALSRGELSIPSTYTELAACAREHMCSVFDSEYNAAGQASTDVHAWRGLTAGAKMPVRCITSTRYEPFVVLRHSEETPKFDERFYGYGKNKVQLVVHLRMAGYAFEVLGKGFLCHFPHPQSAAKRTWLHSSAHAAMDRLFRQFVQEMSAKYADVKPATPMCQ